MIKLLAPLIYGCLLLSAMAAVATTPPASVNLASSTCSTAQIKTRNDLGSKLIYEKTLPIIFF